eukprot:m.113194 g.113194  ORF g.113194 m.113194 type:complete len:275 (-) comp14123_c0_seq1:929-1753(-)
MDRTPMHTPESLVHLSGVETTLNKQLLCSRAGKPMQSAESDENHITMWNPEPLSGLQMIAALAAASREELQPQELLTNIRSESASNHSDSDNHSMKPNHITNSGNPISGDTNKDDVFTNSQPSWTATSSPGASSDESILSKSPGNSSGQRLRGRASSLKNTPGRRTTIKNTATKIRSSSTSSILPYKPARGRARAKQLAMMTPEEIEAEHQARLERNRVCARECRRRKKSRDSDAQLLIQNLKAEVLQKNQIIADLNKRVSELSGLSPANVDSI